MRRSLLVLSAAALMVVGASGASSTGTASAAVDVPLTTGHRAALARVATGVTESTQPADPRSGPRSEQRGERASEREDAPPVTRATATTAIVKTTPREPLPTRPPPAAAKLISSARDACVMSLPVSGDPEGFLASARKVLASKGGTVAGTTTSGSFSVPAPLGRVDGSYAMESGAALLTIAPASLGFVQSCPAVFTALTAALHR